MKKNITISDVALEAGVSKTTVSRYLNGQFGKMSQETKEKIEAVIKELNYRPNKQAQSLKSKRSYLIGVVVSDISNMYSSLLLKGIGEVLGKAGYQMIIMDAANSIEQEKELLNKLIDQSVEGIILQASSRDANHYSFLKEANIPILLVDREVEPLIFPLVTTDNEDATKKIVQVILDKKYDEIVVISEPLKDIITREVRYNSVKEKVLENKKEVKLIEVDKKLDLEQVLSELVNSTKKTAIFASNGRMLMDILTILVTKKIEIPSDIGIVGFDDWNLSALVGPGITSVEQKTKLIGEESGKKILSYLDDEPIVIETFIVPADIQLRNSL